MRLHHSQKNDTMGRSMNERDFNDGTYEDMIPEQDGNVTHEPPSMQYSVSMNTNMRQSMPTNIQNEVDHYQDYFNEWAQSLRP